MTDLLPREVKTGEWLVEVPVPPPPPLPPIVAVGVVVPIFLMPTEEPVNLLPALMLTNAIMRASFAKCLIVLIFLMESEKPA